MVLLGSGNVGIGFTSPQALFTVGTSGQFQVNSTGTITTSGDLAVNGGNLTSTSSTFNLLSSNVSTLNIGDVATTLNLAGGSTSTGCTVNSSGDMTCTGSIAGSSSGTAGFWGRTGTITYLSNFSDNVGIGTSAQYGTAKTFIQGAGTTTDITLQTTGSNLTQGLTVLDNGNVGIGTTGPGNSLEVTSSSSTVSMMSVSGNSTIGFGGATSIVGPSNGLAVSGNVGIGTTTANYNLSVVGTSNITGAATFGGQILGANGTASLPAYSFGSLTNAGLWTNGDGLLLTTGGSATKGITVTGAGYVGIGGTNPYMKLDLKGGSSEAGGSIGLASYTGGASLNRYIGLYGSEGTFADGSGTTNIYFKTESDASSGSIGFVTHSGGVSNATRMVIDKNGNIGIGTSLPSQRFQVNTNASNPVVITSSGNVGIGFTSPGVRLAVSGGVIRIDHSTANLQLYDNDANTGNRAVTVGSTGDGFSIIGYADNFSSSAVNLISAGLGTQGGLVSIGAAFTATGSKLNVSGNLSVGSGYATTAAPTNGAIIQGNVGIGFTSPSASLHVLNTAAQNSFRVDDEANDASPFVIVADGNVGIGNPSPGASLHLGSTGVNNSTGLMNFSSCNSTCGGNRTWQIGNSNDLSGANQFSFRIQDTGATSPGLWMPYESNNVGIGTSTPYSKTHISSNISNIGPLSTSTVTQLKISNPVNVTGNYSLIKFSFPDNDTNALIGARLTSSGSGGADLVFAARSGGSIMGEAMTLTGAGNLGIGTTGPGTLLDVQGAGTSGIQLYLGKTGVNAGGLKIWGATAAQEGNIYNDATYGIRMDTNSNARPIRIDGSALHIMSGNVGIGVTTVNSALVVNQGTTDTSIIQLKSSDVDHGVTARIESDTYGFFQKANPTTGGLYIEGIQEQGTALPAIEFHMGATGDTTKSLAGRGMFEIDSYLSVPTGGGTTTADANIFAIRRNSSTRLIIDDEGSIYFMPSTFAASNPGSRISSVGNSYLMGGNLGIGTTGPTSKLQIVGGNCADDAEGGGCTADYAEIYPSSQDVEKGDLLIIDSDSAVQGAVKRSSAPYQQNILGIVSTAPAAIAEGSNLSFLHTEYILDPRKPAVALAGRVPLKVSTENGPIEIGDYLTSSSTPGVAMKASRPGPVVGKALEAFGGDCFVADAPRNDEEGVTPSDVIASEAKQSCQDKILVFVNVSYADPGNFFANLSMDEDGNLIVPKIKVGSLILDESLATASSSLRASEGSVAISTNEGIASSPSAPRNDMAGNVFYDLSGKIASLEDRIAELEEIASSQTPRNDVIADNSVTATSEGGACCDSAAVSEIASSSATPRDDVALELTPPDILLASGSATLTPEGWRVANLSVTSEATFSGMLTAYELDVQDSLRVFGETILGKTNIVGDLSVDGTLSIENGSEINVIGTLYLQKSSLADKLDIFNGRVTIDNEGNIKTVGEVVAASIVTNKLTISNIPVTASASAAVSGIATDSASPRNDDSTIGTGKILLGKEIWLFLLIKSELAQKYLFQPINQC